MTEEQSKEEQKPVVQPKQAAAESKEEQKPVVQPKQAAAESKEEQKPAAQPKAPASAEEKEAEPKKKKKINRLTLSELEKKITEVQTKMGGLHSTYAQQLLKRKQQLVAIQDNNKTLEDGAGHAA